LDPGLATSKSDLSGPVVWGHKIRKNVYGFGARLLHSQNGKIEGLADLFESGVLHKPYRVLNFVFTGIFRFCVENYDSCWRDLNGKVRAARQYLACRDLTVVRFYKSFCDNKEFGVCFQGSFG
jgi:hypothetical protein